MRQSRIFVGMVLILIFAEVLGLYGYGWCPHPREFGGADGVQTDRGSHPEHASQRLKRRCQSFTTSCTVPAPAAKATCQYSDRVQHGEEAGACDISGRIARRYLGGGAVYTTAVTWGCQEQRWALRCPNKLSIPNLASRPRQNDVRVPAVTCHQKHLRTECLSSAKYSMCGPTRPSVVLVKG